LSSGVPLLKEAAKLVDEATTHHPGGDIGDRAGLAAPVWPRLPGPQLDHAVRAELNETHGPLALNRPQNAEVVCTARLRLR
jgi:hypothetical protein